MVQNTPDQPLNELLERLERVPDDEVSRVTLLGRALSRSDENLHLAVQTGVVGIPLANIERVLSVPGARSQLVRVVVRNPRDILRLLDVQPRPRSAAQQLLDDEIVTDQIGDDVVDGTRTCDIYAKETLTGEEGADADDGIFEDCQQDDIHN